MHRKTIGVGMTKLITDQAKEIQKDLTELRHSIHREPEIGLHLPKTQEKVVRALQGTGIEITTGESLSSVVGVLRGANPGPTVLLRGDMDALPVLEQTDVGYRSRVDGAMHACGHDLHTSMLVGAAILLDSHREDLAGNVVFMFQPGEEGFDGAGKMLEEGVLSASGETPEAAYALHVMSANWPNGTFTTRPGAMMAASDEFVVTVVGSGGHGSAPHLAKDPVPVACEMVIALQTYVTRNIDPFEAVVITVGSFHAGTKRNIIPDTAHFEATIRTFSQATREKVARDVVRICKGIGHAHGVEVEAEYITEYPVTVNDANEVSFVSNVITRTFGADRFAMMANPVAAAEDFSRILASVPGAMVFLGAAPPDQDFRVAPNNHSAFARFEDNVLSDGAALYAELAMGKMSEV